MRERLIVAGFASTLLILAALPGPRIARGDDAEAKVKAQARLGDDPARKLLAEAAQAIHSLEKKREGGGLLDFRAFAMRLTPEDKADVFRAIGLAQARVGDGEGAAKSWQDAVDAANEAPDAAARAGAFCAIAEAQAETAVRAEALGLLQQAVQAARLIKDDPDLPTILRNAQGEAGARRVNVLTRIAAVQATLGDRAAASKTIRQAEQAVESIGDPLARASSLAEIAKATDPGMVRQAWAKAIEFASAIDDPWIAGRATEAVSRARANSGGYDEALTLVRDGLKGDLASYALWVVADEMAKADKPAPAAALTRLLGMAEAAGFDRITKKSKVFGRLAEAMADAGDAEVAERTVGKLDEDPDRHFNFLMARVAVLSRLAKAQLAAGRKDAAITTLKVALDIVAPYRGGDGTGLFPLQEIAQTLARAGEFAAAIDAAEEIPTGSARAAALAAVAVIQAESADRAAAARTLARATRAADVIPNETLWSMGSTLDGPFGIGLGASMKTNALETIAIARAKAGDLPTAIKDLEALKTGTGTTHRPPSTTAAGEIALLQAKAGDYAGALKTAESLGGDEMLADQSKVTTLAKIARLQAVAGDPRDVLAWATKQNLPKAKVDVLKNLAEAIAEARGPRKPKASP